MEVDRRVVLCFLKYDGSTELFCTITGFVVVCARMTGLRKARSFGKSEIKRKTVAAWDCGEPYSRGPCTHRRYRVVVDMGGALAGARLGRRTVLRSTTMCCTRYAVQSYAAAPSQLLHSVFQVGLGVAELLAMSTDTCSSHPPDTHPHLWSRSIGGSGLEYPARECMFGPGRLDGYFLCGACVALAAIQSCPLEASLQLAAARGKEWCCAA